MLKQFGNLIPYEVYIYDHLVLSYLLANLNNLFG